MALHVIHRKNFGLAIFQFHISFGGIITQAASLMQTVTLKLAAVRTGRIYLLSAAQEAPEKNAVDKKR